MKTKFFYLACIVLACNVSVAQVKIGNNPTTINSASLLELETTNKGFVPPRVSLTDVSTSSPLPAGLLTGTLVYNTNSSATGGSGVGIYLWDGSKWVLISTGSSVSSSAWLLTGNGGTTASGNFIGTTDAVDFVTRTANTERMRILGAASGSSKAGWIGMGVTIPRSSLDVTGHYSNKNVLTLENSSTSGYSSVDMMDSAGNLKGTFGYANSGTGGIFAGKDYFNIYSTDFLFTVNSGNNDFYMKGSTGYIGLNTNAPSERLHVVGNFYLNGAFMPGGTAGTSGYVLTSAGTGVSPVWTNSSSLAWSLTGNAGTNYSNNFLGTTDNTSLRFRTNNIERMIIDSFGSVGIGSSVFNTNNREKVLIDYGTTVSSTVASIRGNIDNFLQVNLQNQSSGVNASTDYVATSNDGTDSTYYVDMGINSSTYAPGIENFGGPHDAYLYASSRNLLIGTASSNTDVVFLLGGGKLRTNAIMRLNASDGHVVIGKGDATLTPVGTTLRGPNAVTGAANLAGGSLTLSGGSSTGTATGGDLNVTGGATSGSGAGGAINITGGSTAAGISGAVNINSSINSATNINTGTSTGIVTLGNALNNINLPKLSASSVVLTDAGKNLTSTTPSNNTYLYYNGANFTWATAASSLASLTNGAGIASLNYNGSSAATASLANGTAAGQVYVTGAAPFTPSLVTMSGDATISSSGALTLATVNGNAGTFNTVTVNAKGLVTAASNVSYTTLGSFSATAPLTYNNITGVFAINQATTSANGYLSSTDWNTFNNKVGSITLNTPSSVFSNPINFSVSSGAATGTLSLNTQTANTVFAGPAAGVAATPTFRALTAADIPSLAGSYIQNQNTLQASSNFNISGNGTIGTNLSVTGTSTLTGAVTSNGGITNTGVLTSSGGVSNINASSNFATNINTGTSTGIVTLGNALNNINLPKLSASSVVLTDAGKNLTSTTPSNNTYLYYNGANFTWATAASSLASLTNGAGIASLNYNGSSAATASLANGTAAGQVYVTGAAPFTPSLVTMSGDATISSSGALTLATVNGNAGTFNTVTVNAKGLVTAASNVSYTTLGSFSATAPLTYNNITGVFAINQATTSANGYLSSTDWNTFNNKVGSITLNTPSSVFSNPINFSVSSGAATGTLSLNTQTANTVFAGPAAGAAATPTFRALTSADIPSLAASYIQNQNTLQASSNFNISGNGTIGTNLVVTGTSTLTGAVTSNGGITNTGVLTSSGGVSNINASSNFATNINTGTSTSNVIIGNNSNNILLPKFNTAGGMIYTTAVTGQIAGTGSNMTWDDVNNRLGIGITAPVYKLSVLSASNPLYLSGVQATASFSTDSILTILNGVVKKAPYSSLPGSNGWLLTGNSGTTTATNFLGTTDLNGLVFKVNNIQAGYLGLSASSYATSFGVGSSGTSTGFQATAIGAGAQATANTTVALGYNASATVQDEIAIGNAATATVSNEAIAIGHNARANSFQGIALGAGATASTNNQTIAIGNTSLASGFQGIAIGYSADATTNNSALAIGVNSTATGLNSTAIGNGTSATGQSSTAIGDGAATSQANALVLGNTSAQVGIGTSTPASTLDVQSSGATSGNVLNVTGSGITTGNAVNVAANALTSGNVMKLSSTSTAGAFLGSSYLLNLSRSGVNANAGHTAYGINASVINTGLLNTNIAAQLSASGGLFNYALIVPSGGGNVGFGTSVPGSTLDVKGTLRLSGSASGYVGFAPAAAAGSTTYTWPSADGNNNQVLSTNGSGTLGWVTAITAASAWTTTGNSGTSANTNFIGTKDNVDFVTKTNNTERMRVTSAGDVVIGAGDNSGSVTDGTLRASTATGGNKTGANLDIQAGNGTGNGGSGDIIFSTGAAGSNNGSGADVMSERMRITDAGTVGIGTSAPNASTKLDVAGSVKIGASGTAIKSIQAFATTINQSIVAGGATQVYATITIPTALSSTQAVVTISPAFDLAAGIYIDDIHAISTTQIHLRLVNSTPFTVTLNGTFYVQITEF